MKFHFQVIKKDNKPTLFFGNNGNDLPFRHWLKNNIGKYGTIEPRDKISKESRGYFEGALCQAYIAWRGGNPDNYLEVEEASVLFKSEFSNKVVNGIYNTPIKIKKSTRELSNSEFSKQIINKVVEYFVEHNIPVPNPDLYKMWKNKWKDKYPLYSFWKFLQVFNIKCDTGVEESKMVIDKEKDKDIIKAIYPVNNLGENKF